VNIAATVKNGPSDLCEKMFAVTTERVPALQQTLLSSSSLRLGNDVWSALKVRCLGGVEAQAERRWCRRSVLTKLLSILTQDCVAACGVEAQREYVV
jgi:hypothetical protein